jgi:arylsulfatase A-like enzyme
MLWRRVTGAVAGHLGPLLLVAGVGAVAVALFTDRLQGEPFLIGWTELWLLVLGGICLVASPARVRESFKLFLRESRRKSPSFLAARPSMLGLFARYGAWLWLTISFLEVGLRAYQKASNKRVYGLRFLWEVPLGYAAILGALALVCYLIGRRASRGLLVQTLVWASCFVAMTGWLVVVIPSMGVQAAALLAAGIATQLARVAKRHSYAFDVIVGRTTPWLAIVVVGLAIGSFMWPIWKEHRAIADLPAVTDGGTNVLLIVLDTVRAKSLGLYGYARATTPNLDRFGARGVVFDRAIATAPWTLPSHGSMFTGRHPHELNADWLRPLDATHRTLAEVLASHGYLTAGFVANTLYTPTEFGLARGFAHYEDHDTSLKAAVDRTAFAAASRVPLLKAIGQSTLRKLKTADEVNREFLTWLEAREKGRPYFAFLNYFDAHNPYLSPDEFARQFSTKPPRVDFRMERLDEYSPDEIREFNDAYDGTLAFLDHHLGLLFAELERRDEMDRTLVIITADHGEQFGEHGLLDHAASLYMTLLHVPLYVIYPARVPAGGRVKEYASLRDLPATILDLIGLKDSMSFPGASLVPYWEHPERPIPRTAILAETGRAPGYPKSYPANKGPMASVVFKDWHYIKNFGDGREELYDIAKDLEELENLAGKEPLLVEEFRGYLRDMRPDLARRIAKASPR